MEQGVFQPLASGDIEFAWRRETEASVGCILCKHHPCPCDICSWLRFLRDRVLFNRGHPVTLPLQTKLTEASTGAIGTLVLE